MFLDKVVLKYERFCLVRNLDPIQALGFSKHLLSPNRKITYLLEVTIETISERLCLSHIENPAFSVLKEIRSWFGGDALGRWSLYHQLSLCSGLKKVKPFIEYQRSQVWALGIAL